MLVTGFVNTRVSIDNWSFKFYYKYTTSLLLLCSAGTTARFKTKKLRRCDSYL